MLGVPGLEEKSSISLLSRKPRPSAVAPQAEEAVERVGHGDGVAIAIDDGEVGRLVGFLRCGDGGWRGQEVGRPDERSGWRGADGMNRVRPCAGVLSGGHLFNWDAGVVGVPEILGAVLVRAAKGFGDQVHLADGAVGTLVSQLEVREDVERLKQRDAAGGWRRRGD